METASQRSKSSLSSSQSTQTTSIKKRIPDLTSSFHRYSKSAKLKIKKPSKPIESLTPSYVGFRPPDMKSINDLSHLRLFVEAHPSHDQAESVLENLNQMLKKIPTDGYESFDPNKKYETIQKLLDAYSFAWNEATLQLKQISEEHAEIFAKIKSFYLFLLQDYPQLLVDYQQQIAKLKTQSLEKEQHISILKKDFEQFSKKDNEAREFIASLRDEINRLKERKKYFKQELNEMTLKNDRLQEELTETRCKFAKEIQNGQGQIKLDDINSFAKSIESLVPREPMVALIDVGTNTGPMKIVQSNIQLEENLTLSTKNYSTERFNLTTDAQSSVDPNGSLRHLIFNFMISEAANIEGPLSIDPNIELKKFHWLYPKIISLLISGIQIEDPHHPFTSFQELFMTFLSHHYHTTFLIQTTYASIVQSTHIYDEVDPAIHLFNKFVKCDYDFFVFRFFHTMLEFTACYTTPDLSSLVTKEGIGPEESKIMILKENARNTFNACFPLQQIPDLLNDGPNNINNSYWEFMEILIQEFETSRNHFWAVLKNALLLSDCPDITHISFQQFSSFMGIIFPGITSTEIKSHWKQLVIREAASEKENSTKKQSNIDLIEFTSLTFLCASKDENILNIMSIQPVRNFVKIYYDLNSPMLDVLTFVVNRLTYYIPALMNAVPESISDFEKIALNIRDSLFECDVSKALGYYRFLLSKLDYIHVTNFSNIVINHETTPKDMEELIEHIKLREKVAGITSYY